ncbi:LysR substrate-binding domain-containing protein [Pseudoroseomonas ludipueritiae]|uniref:LysR family transcriptional regulator n=1 Tax=Pseudoroseomonas ludipueritiae TaxID=198093 RepID=A0ABR7R614_9PROT|nr:LysR substrate-binding domain-containing protein [Pseudoroseomonas ludipueritiae]MBC9177104.1 LysR family transcriptional regulator [Pseudoroseomonas ludipueritiae]
MEVFRAVVRTGSITGASRVLGMSQPGVSKILAQTEDLCGFCLFERLHGRLVPTQRGLNLFEETERLFVGMEEIGHLVERLRAEQPRRAVIASIPVLAQELMPPVTGRWLRHGGPERLAVTTRDAGGVMAMAASRRAELGLSCAPARVPGMRSFLLARARALCALPPGHALAERDTIRPADLHGQPFVAISRHEGPQALVDRVLQDEGVRPVEMAECPLIIGAAGMAHAGVGIAFTDAFAARPFIPRGLVLRDFEPALVFEYRAIWSEGMNNQFDRAAFLRLLGQCAEEILSETPPGRVTRLS